MSLNSNTSLNIEDIIRVSLHPGKFFAYSKKHPKRDVEFSIYNEYTGKYKRTAYPLGVLKEIFKNRVTEETWVLLYNRPEDIMYGVPKESILEIC